MSQLGLALDLPPEPAPPPRRLTPRERWVQFHAANPAVYKLFERFALEAARSGRQRFGARAIWERLRWHLAIEVVGDEAFKLNDHYPPYYAREFARRHPEHAALFEFRSRGNRPPPR